MFQPLPSLAGVRVLDLCDRWGQFAAKLLTQLGADVVLAEPTAGHELRSAWPMAIQAGKPVSVYFWHFNAGKRSVLWDTSSSDGMARARALIDAADIVLVSEETYRGLVRDLPDDMAGATVVCISAYGVGHPDPARADDLHVAAQSGMPILSGYGDDDESEPILAPVEQAMHCAGLYGAIAALAALRSQIPRVGQFLDVSAQAAAFQSTEQLFGHWVYRKEHLRRRGGGYATPVPSERWEVVAADGNYIYAYGMIPRTEREWRDLREWMRSRGRIEDLDDDPIYDSISNLQSPYPLPPPDAGKHAMDVVKRFIGTLDAETCYREGQARKMTWARMYEPHDTLGEEQLRVRRLFQKTAWPGASATYLTQTLPWVLRGEGVLPSDDVVITPPLIGEHTDAVIAEWLSAP